MNQYINKILILLSTTLVVSACTIGSDNINKQEISGSGIDQVNISSTFSCILHNNKPSCWGNNSKGSLGNGSTTSSFSPQQVINLKNINKIIVAGYSVFAMDINNHIYGWGGIIADPNKEENIAEKTELTLTPKRLTIQEYLNEEESITDIATTTGNNRYNSQYLLTSSGQILSYGDNSRGQLGQDSVGDIGISYPINTVVSNQKYSQLAHGSEGYSQCAITDDKQQVDCWGDNSNHQISEQGTIMITKPTKMKMPVQESIKTVSIAPDHICILTYVGNIYCQGGNKDGQVGINSKDSIVPQLTKVAVENGIKFVDLETSDSSTIATTDTTTGTDIYAWGQTYGPESSGTNFLKPTKIDVNNKMNQFKDTDTVKQYKATIYSASDNNDNKVSILLYQKSSNNITIQGDNEGGKLGTGNEEDVKKPQTIKLNIS